MKEYEKGLPLFSISILHGAAQSLPDPLEYFNKNNSDLSVKVEVLGNKLDIRTMPLIKFHQRVQKTFSESSRMYREGGLT